MDTWYTVLPNRFFTCDIHYIYKYWSIFYIIYIIWYVLYYIILIWCLISRNYYIFIWYLSIESDIFCFAWNRLWNNLGWSHCNFIANQIWFLLFFHTMKTFATAFTAWICISIFSKRQKSISLYKYCIRSLDSAK